MLTAFTAYEWPRLMEATLAHASRKASTEHAAIERQLQVDTAKLRDDIEDASAQVAAFSLLSDLNEQTEFAARGLALMEFLEGINTRSAVINDAETLFELPRSDWPRVASLQKDLRPYIDLWVRREGEGREGSGTRGIESARTTSQAH